jgi:hypothetical protein
LRLRITGSQRYAALAAAAAPSGQAVRGGAYTFGGGKGSRIGSGLSFAKIAINVMMRGDNG